MTDQGQISVETEIALVVCSDQPERVIEEIGALSALDRYRLGRGTSFRFEDLYLDSRGIDLGSRRYALRIRTSRGTKMITLKGPSRATGAGTIERPELEAVVSQESWDRIRMELECRGIRLPEAHLEPANPLKGLEDAGLEIVQHRETERLAKDLFVGQQDTRIAELAIDRVEYRFLETAIFHSELEVEMKDANSFDDVSDFVRQLIVRFEGKLLPWRHSKFATGIVIQSLLTNGMLGGFLDQDNRLRPNAYAIIAKRLT